MDAILDVDLLAFEQGTAAERAAVVDGTMRSLETGFVYTAHDVSTDLIDQAYEMLATFFALDTDTKAKTTVEGTHGQTGYTGLLVETAASSDHPDWKEMLNWGDSLPVGHPLRTQFPTRYHDPVLPEADVAGITDVLLNFHRSIANLQRRFLRIIAMGVGADEALFDETVSVGANLTRAIRYPPMESAPGDQHVWAGAHADINLITALPRATARGLQVEIEGEWVDALPPRPCDHQHWAHARTVDEWSYSSRHAPGRCRSRSARTAAVSCAVLPSCALDHAHAALVVHHPRTTTEIPADSIFRRTRRSSLADQPGRRRPAGFLANSTRHHAAETQPG